MCDTLGPTFRGRGVREDMMRFAGKTERVGALCMVALLAMGCATTTAPTSSAPEPGQSSPATAAATTPKTLRIGIARDIITGVVLFGGSGLAGMQYAFTFHSGLTVYDAQGNLLPRMAQKVPSVADGDWVVRPDGTMQVTWKLRPDLKWHDGEPVTADDFVFGVQLLGDSQLPLARSSAQTAISTATAPEPQTLVLEYRKVYVQANASGPIDVVAVPRHLLGELYNRGDRQVFINSPYWMGEFVGTGPYKLGDWAHGNTVEAVAFDQYFMGRPKVDRIIYTVMPDDNVIYVNLLSGAIDMTTMGGFLIDNVVRAKEEWEAKGSGTVLALFAGTRDYRFQFLNPAAPWAKDVRVRRAMTHMLDRHLLAETIQFGLTTAADTIVSPSDPVYALLEQRGLPKYPYDLNRAHQLMTDAGWSRGAEGTYRSAAGEPFSIDIQNTNSSEDIKQAVAVAGQWNAAGILTTNTPVANGATNINELQRTFPGVQASPQRDTLEALESLLSHQIGTAANRWQGDNRNTYVSPTIDRLYDQALVTFDTPTRQGLMADILKIEAEEVPAIHMFYYMSRQSVTFRKGVTGPGLVPTNQMVNAWNIETWDVN